MSTAFDARSAVSVIQDMEGYEEGLRRRTEGITWMVWALVFAGIATSYWVMGILAPPGSHDAAWRLLPDGGLVTPWIGWAIAGGLATSAIWRGAALHGASGLRHVGALGAIMVGKWVLFVASWFLVPAAIGQYLYAGGPLVFFGLATLIVVSTKLVPLTRQGRSVARVVALGQIGLALVVGGLVGSGVVDAAIPIELVGAVAIGGMWLAGGMWQTAQG